MYSKHTVVLSKLTHKVFFMLSRLYTNSRSHCFWNLSNLQQKVSNLWSSPRAETRRIETNMSLFGSSGSSRLPSLGMLSPQCQKLNLEENRQRCVHSPNKVHVNIHSCLLWPSLTYCNKSSIMLKFQCCHVNDGSHPPRISGSWSKNESIVRMMNVVSFL